MAAFNVSIGELEKKAGELIDLNGKFKDEVMALIDLQNALGSMWEGDAKKAFQTAFGRDVEQMRTFYNAVNDYATALLNNAQRYADAESRNVETANTRTYG